MLSAVKNFFLTFVLSLVIFGLIASLAVGLVVNNINGSLSSESDTSAVTTAEETNEKGEVVTPISQVTGDSLNILLLGTDYRPSVLADYDPEVVEKLYPSEETEQEIKVRPSDLAAPSTKTVIISDDVFSDKYKEYTVLDDDTLMFKDGFYKLSYRVIETDAIILIRLDKERGHISYTSFQPDAITEVSGKEIRLSEIYGTYGVVALTDTIHAITGINIDRYALISMENFPALVDKLGGIDFTVPCKMKYDDYAGNIHINLSAGTQKLDGEKALQLLMFNGYTDGINTRGKTTTAFLRAMASTFFKVSNLSKMSDFWNLIEGMYETNLEVTDITKNAELLIKCVQNQFEINAVTKTKVVDGETRLYVDDIATADAFASYRRQFGTQNQD